MNIGSIEYREAIEHLIATGIKVLAEKIRAGNFNTSDLEKLDKIARLEYGRPTEAAHHSFNFVPVDSAEEYAQHEVELKALEKLFNGATGN